MWFGTRNQWHILELFWRFKIFQDIRWLENWAERSKKALSPVRDCPDMEVIGFEKSCN